MSWFSRIRAKCSRYGTLLTLVVFPLARIVWKFLAHRENPASPSSRTTSSKDAYARGDVIDVQVKK